MTQDARRGVTLGRVMTLAAAVLGGFLLAVLLFDALPRTEEAPIRVKNGSVKIESEGGWDEAGDYWSPKKGHNSGAFYVKVTPPATGNCSEDQTEDGKEVEITTTDDAKITFFKTGNNLTKVRPKNRLTRNGDYLNYSGPGKIKKVEVKKKANGASSWSCEFDENSAQAPEITICSFCESSHCK